MAFQINSTTVVSNKRAFTLGTATPAAPATGMIRFNSTASRFEVYNGTAWVDIRNAGTNLGPSLILYSWGFNNNGQLGTGTTTSRNSPGTVLGNGSAAFTDWVNISVGIYAAGGIRSNGQMFLWGKNLGGELGDGSFTNRSSPVSVVGGFTDWVDIAIGSEHTAGIRSNGQAWCWGTGSSGQLGDGTNVGKNSPVSVVGGFTDWSQIACADFATMAVRANGQLWAWGNNTNGALGTGDTTARSSPVSVLGGFSDWVQIATTQNHSIGLRASGDAWGMGLNFSRGSVGNGSNTNVSSPVLVVGGHTWTQVSVGGGGAHTLAVRADGRAYSWGRNTNGQLGDYSTTSRSSPVLVAGNFTDWAQLAAGYSTSFGVRANGTAWAWGRTNLGQMGTGVSNSTNYVNPIEVAGGFTDWVKIVGGRYTGFAIRSR